MIASLSQQQQNVQHIFEHVSREVSTSPRE